MNCITCVGLYFPIDNTRCFLAHINAYVTVTQEGRKKYHTRACDRYEGEKIYDIVVKKLVDVARDNGWSPQDVDTTKLIVVCPDVNIDDGEPMTGHYIMAAIRNFLNLSVMSIRRGDHGFIVDASTGKTTWLTQCFDEDESLLEMLHDSWKQKVGGEVLELRGTHLDRPVTKEWEISIERRL